MWQVYTRPTSASDFFIANFHVLGFLYLKNEFRAGKMFRLSRGVAVGFWTKFEAQLAQPC
jgi:hypothetical protein